ncbi:beta-glucosidase BglX [Macellibacteroides fermentans]|uniref:Periplasmic beta-glucosidase n=1 Tax=Parabacteroides chartae TaxID=1037355 RepID=A0A1T5DTC4_9BACT|nr:beta-glucosidase BglX [Parabacteroides chartae]SKB75072.1 beta-glucosidase [Parabacteroides chartae]
MKKIVTVITSLTLLAALGGCKPSASGWKSYSGDKTIEQRVDSVLKLMTLEEKIGQMAQFSCNWDVTGPIMADDFEPYLRKGLVGSIFNAYTVDGVRKLQEMALTESRLKIPVLFGYDVIHGFRTIFPMPLAEASSWDLELMRKSAAIAAEEASAEGIHWTFAPMVDIARDARWGRVMEGAGEDPYLGSLIAKARVEGFQGGKDWQSLQDLHTVLACCKHFAAYGAAESGRDYNNAELSLNTLMNYYMPPYKAAHEAGVATYMASFNEIGGVPSTASKFLFTDLLRNDWGFKGFVVTDYTGINELVPHGVAADEKEAGELAANAGIDMDMTGAVFSKYLKQSVEEGKVSEETINNAVRRILEMKFILGLFDDPYRYLDKEREKNTIMKPEFLQAARETAARSIVLLKNEKSFFPITKDKSLTVALIGPMVKDKVNQNGEWAGKGNREQSVSLYEGLTEKYAGTNVKFVYAQGCDLTTDNRDGFAEALATARRADVVLAVMGEDFNWSGEAASRSDIRLPGAQQELLKELKKTGKPVGVVLMNGRPLDLSWEDANLDAIMEAWYLGTMSGHGLADVIAGDYNPSGRLTMSFPRNVGQLPIYYNHKNTGRPLPADNPKMDYKSSYLDVANTPLYPFGYGLSYTTFQISNMQMDKSSMGKGDKVTVTAEVKNTGTVDGETVVQLYIRDLVASVTRPVKELKGFTKVALKSGESKKVSFTVTEAELSFYDIDLKYTAEPGNFELWVAADAADETNQASLVYTAK